MVTTDLIDELRNSTYPMAVNDFTAIVLKHGGGGSPRGMIIRINCYCKRNKIKVNLNFNPIKGEVNLIQ